MDDSEILAEDLERKFNDQFKELMAEGYPPKLITSAFVNQSMLAFRVYLASNDPSRIPALLRRFASTVESRIASRK